MGAADSDRAVTARRGIVTELGTSSALDGLAGEVAWGTGKMKSAVGALTKK